MSKYIVELFDGVQVLTGVGASPSGTVWSRSYDVDELEELNSDYINEHFGELQDEAYQSGLNDAWEAAKKIFGHEIDGGLDIDELKKAFGSDVYCTADIIRTNTAEQAIAKLKTYESKDSDRIEVGDVVERYIDGKLDSKGIYLQEDGGYWRCLFYTGAVLMTFAYPKGQFKKTGKHYDIASILEAMRK